MSRLNGRNLSAALAAAANTLLAGTSQAAGFGLLDDESWKTEAMILYYSEGDRVSALEPVIQATRALDTDESLTARLTLDTLTGASGSGAVPSSRPQVFTRPSGGGSYRTSPGEVPLDDTFKDTRASFNLSWLRPVGENMEMTVGGNISREFDYVSLSANTQLAYLTQQNNRTWSIGLAVASDSISPVGGAPVPLSIMETSHEDDDDEDEEDDEFEEEDEEDEEDDDDDYGGGLGDQSKQTIDMLLGFTQVLDRNSLFQLTAGISQVDGYQNDPYKIISVVDDDGEVVYRDADISLPLVLHENRPDVRSKQSLYAQYKRWFDGRILDASYRFTTDDWGIDSHTIETSLRFPLGNSKWLQPRLRYYHQSAADFYTPWFLEGTQPSSTRYGEYASADYRLGEMATYMVGLEFGHDGRRDWSVALEYYSQQPTEPAKFGRLDDYTLAPAVNALIVRFGSTF